MEADPRSCLCFEKNKAAFCLSLEPLFFAVFFLFLVALFSFPFVLHLMFCLFCHEEDNSKENKEPTRVVWCIGIAVNCGRMQRKRAKRISCICQGDCLSKQSEHFLTVTSITGTCAELREGWLQWLCFQQGSNSPHTVMPFTRWHGHSSSQFTIRWHLEK